jgi:hypothetical protein
MIRGLMNKNLLLLLLCAGLAATGCSTRAKLTITTEPEGGYVANLGGKLIGMAPVTVYYDPAVLQGRKDSQGCFVVTGFEAQWQSGATTKDTPIRLCGTPTGTYDIQLTRDRNYPGLALDMAAAMQLRRQEAEGQAAKNAALAAWLKANQANQQKTAKTLDAESVPAGPVSGTAARFKGSYVSGTNRICLYDRLGSEVAVTVGAFQGCPGTPP